MGGGGGGEVRGGGGEGAIGAVRVKCQRAGVMNN